LPQEAKKMAIEANAPINNLFIFIYFLEIIIDYKMAGLMIVVVSRRFCLYHTQYRFVVFMCC
ncbi:hypothetical protein, partial [Stenotrophomonas maltophilia]|uniref:hypothetical protein n=1 Tax=Stenotrophomonas maltophilia TaxID=40324 RepID=UPI001953178A